MNKLMSSENSPLLLLTAFVAALLCAVYYYLVVPKTNEVEAKSNSIEQLGQEIASLEEQLTQTSNEQMSMASNSLAMRKKVPETRAIEQVILDITQIEEVTGTRVESVNFNYDVDVAQTEVTESNTIEKAEVAVDEEQTKVEENVPVPTIAKETLPANLKLVTFTIEVAALDFNALDRFLKEIENLERVMKTDTISFKLPGEQDRLETEKDLSATATVQITTFYYEGEK